MTNNIDKQSFGEAGCVIVTGTSGSPAVVPAGQYCAVSFITDGSISTAFSATEAPIMSGTQTGITFPSGYTILTPLSIVGTSVGRIIGSVIFYRAL